jgi:hypothetical protein
MAEHYSTRTESMTAWCNRCGRRTQHHVSGHRIGRCLEHDPPKYTQAQRRRLETARRQDQQPGLFPAH